MMPRVRKKKMVEDLRVPIFRCVKLYPSWQTDTENLVKMLKEKKRSFTVDEYFSCNVIKWIDGTGEKRRDYFQSEFTHKSILAMKDYLKINIASKIIDTEKAKRLNLFKYTQRYIYREKQCITAFQYDLKNAYPSILRMYPFVDKNVFEKLTQFKTNGYSASKILGMALLGSKTIVEYKDGKKISFSLENECTEEEKKKMSEKEATKALHGLLNYVTCASIGKFCEEYNSFVFARYVDSFIVDRKIDEEILREKFFQAVIKVFSDIEMKLKKYCGFNIKDIFSIQEEEINYSELINFHEVQVESLTYSYDTFGHRKMSFYRETKDKKNTEKVSYAQND